MPRRVDPNAYQEQKSTQDRKPSVLPNPVPPTGDRRHTTAIRLGKVSGEIFSRKLRERILVDPQ